MADNRGMADVLLGMAIWGAIIYLLVRLILKKGRGNSANASANAEATAEGGNAAAGSGASVNVYLVLGNNSGIIPALAGANPGAIVNVPELLAGGNGELDGAGTSALHSGEFQQDASGNVAGAVHRRATSRNSRRRNGVEVTE